jgi:hypothetical protein
VAEIREIMRTTLLTDVIPCGIPYAAPSLWPRE